MRFELYSSYGSLYEKDVQGKRMSQWFIVVGPRTAVACVFPPATKLPIWEPVLPPHLLAPCALFFPSIIVPTPPQVNLCLEFLPYHQQHQWRIHPYHRIIFSRQYRPYFAITRCQSFWVKQGTCGPALTEAWWILGDGGKWRKELYWKAFGPRGCGRAFGEAKRMGFQHVTFWEALVMRDRKWYI